MAKSSTSAKRAAPAKAPSTPGNGPDQGATSEIGAHWARDAMTLWLAQTRSLFDMVQTLQQAQVRALQDVAADMDSALNELEEAEDMAALSAVPGRLLNAQWQHTVENAGSAAQRLFEIESAWLQQAQAQAAERWAAVANGAGDLPASPLGGALPLPSPFAALSGNGQGASSAAEMPAQFRQWFEQWQKGVEQASRNWNEALKSAQAQ
jgi:hypothetical protein